MNRISFAAVFCLLAVLHPGSAARAVTVPGPVVVGDGLPNGIGTTLGRFFVRLSGLEGNGDRSIPLELLLTSGVVTVDPITCSEASPDPCAHRAKGLAAVSGNPTAFFGSVMLLKLASALYVSRFAGAPHGPGALAGYSVEVALEGALFAGPETTAGTPATLRLAEGRLVNLIRWASSNTREYDTNTGTALVLGDEQYFLFPGVLRGEVAENTGHTVLVQFNEADIPLTSSPVPAVQLRLAPDLEAAARAGLPPGVFGQIEVNYSTVATLSRVFPPAASNDVELHATAVPYSARPLRGDCNGDGSVLGALSDALFLLNFNFLSGSEPPCLAACDANADGRVLSEISDAVYLLQYQFLGGPPPPPPFPTCALEDDPSSLGCEAPPPCASDGEA